jgi:hypothetical protein
MPAGFDIHARTAGEAIALLQQGVVTLISLARDLGDPENGTGYEVARWIEEQAFRWSQGESGGLQPLEWRIHSQNPVGLQNMVLALQNAFRFWSWARGDTTATSSSPSVLRRHEVRDEQLRPRQPAVARR